MIIRRAKAAELPLLLAIDGGVKRDPTHPAWLRRALAERSAWVLVRKQSVVAYGVLRRSFFDRWFVESLYVSADCRRTGCGSRMLEFFEARVSTFGELWTSTNQSNRAMQQLLKKRGYVRYGRVTGLDRGDPELIYCKRRP
jgi:ribosomal protein S18 acetylase RimI-like enzyme